MKTLEEEESIPCLEFKSHDSAWYKVGVELQHDKLAIRYVGVQREEKLSLQNVEDMEELKMKLRCPSIRLKDKHCRKALPRSNVCAFHSDSDRRYFDALVENVSWSRHLIVNREEQCMCSYEVLWLAGPHVGKKTTVHCENICLRCYKSIQSHPIVKDVLNYFQNKRTCKLRPAAEISLQKKIVHRDNVHKQFKPRADDFLAEKVEKRINGGDKYWIDVEDELGDLNLKPTGNECERIYNLENAPNETCELYNRNKVELSQKHCYDEITECDAKKFRYNNSSGCCEPLSEVTKVDYIIGFESSASPWKRMGKFEESMDHKLNVKDIILPSEENFHLHAIVDVSNEAYADGNLSFPKQENMDTLAASCKLESCDSEKGTLACIAHVTYNAKDENILKRPSECVGDLLDRASPRTGEDCSRDILGKSDNAFDCHPSYLSAGRHANCINERKRFPEDCSRSLDEGYKKLSPVMINVAKQDVRSKENVLWEKEKILDAAQIRAIMTAHNIYSHGRSRQPKVTNNKIPHRDNYIQNCGPQRKEEPKDQQMLFPAAHVIVLENLDKDVTPSDVLSVICQAGGDSAKVYIMPTKYFEKFTRGFVCFQDEASFQRVSAFLRNENILIASSDGRPWVVIDEGNGFSQGYLADHTSGSEYCGHVLSDNIHILFKGTPEYRRAEKLRSKFLECWEHLKLLHKGLAYSENVIVQASMQTTQL